jgi:2-polyprenyl-3-methyl-5-hydroxy-6-metoxy-1,4-benzoquinol methylase
MGDEKYRVIEDPVYGYKRLEPVPDEKEIANFYKTQYYEKVREGKSAAELHRFLSRGEEAERERSWLRATLYSDVSYVLNQYAINNRVLDVGCGTGEMLSFLRESGFDTTGIEPSEEAVKIVQTQGITAFNCTLEDFVDYYKSSGMNAYAAVVLLNILEHVPKPEKLLELTKEVMEQNGGIICVRVPNDFNELQSIARQELNKEPWWIALPDHINYFDFSSLQALLERFGFEVIYSQGDFPMELFLLMGDDYVSDPEIGKTCHQKRVNFEKKIPGELRRRIYQTLAEVGVGRNCLVFGKLG